MEDLPISLLLQQERAKPKTGEELETFGKYAANLYLNGRCRTLTEAVVESVKTAGLSPEQVKRVVEFTNTGAYLKKFASEGQSHKYIHFKGGPASFPDIIRDLNDGGNPVMSKAASLALDDYQLPPPSYSDLEARNSERMGLVDIKLAEAFAAEEVAIPYEEPLREVLDLRDKVAGLHDEAMNELNSLEVVYLDICDQLYNEVKQAALSGVPLGHVVAAMSSASDDQEFVKSAFAMLTPRFIQNEVFRSEDSIAQSLEKTAGVGLVNTNHPLVGCYAAFCNTLQKLAATRMVRDEALTHLDTISRYMVKASNAGNTAKTVHKMVGHVPKVWRAVTDATAKASEPAAEFGKAIGGERAGKALGGLVKYSPHIAAGFTAEEAYQRAKNDPAMRAVRHFALSRVPYTSENMMRQYNMQMGL